MIRDSYIFSKLIVLNVVKRNVLTLENWSVWKLLGECAITVVLFGIVIT